LKRFLPKIDEITNIVMQITTVAISHPVSLVGGNSLMMVFQVNSLLTFLSWCRGRFLKSRNGRHAVVGLVAAGTLRTGQDKFRNGCELPVTFALIQSK
jgi:hypothetical protein